MQNEAEIFGTVLKAARQEAGLTVETLAERIGVTERYIYRLENNGKTPGDAVLCRLIRDLAISPDLLFYPEKSTQDSEVDSLIRKLATCDERALTVAKGRYNFSLTQCQRSLKNRVADDLRVHSFIGYCVRGTSFLSASGTMVMDLP